jgi:hypothetical protein
MSKLAYVSSHNVSHYTYGHIASVGNLQLKYSGSLANNMFVSLVDQTFSSNYPCSNSTNVEASADTAHSGSIRAGGSDKVLTFSTLGLSTSLAFAVCYTDGLGGGWVDSGVRLTMSKITLLKYGFFATRVMTSTNLAESSNRLPQVASIALTYDGDLSSSKWLSFVQATLNGSNPCEIPTTAAATADTAHSGALQAANGTKVITVPQTPLLNAEHRFAVCYAEQTGSMQDTTWRDSYLRLQMSKIVSVTSHKITQSSIGQIANVHNLQLTYLGSLDTYKWVSLVDQQLNNGFPCDAGAVAAGGRDSQHTGPIQALAGQKNSGDEHHRA